MDLLCVAFGKLRHDVYIRIINREKKGTQRKPRGFPLRSFFVGVASVKGF